MLLYIILRKYSVCDIVQFDHMAIFLKIAAEANKALEATQFCLFRNRSADLRAFGENVTEAIIIARDIVTNRSLLARTSFLFARHHLITINRSITVLRQTGVLITSSNTDGVRVKMTPATCKNTTDILF